MTEQEFIQKIEALGFERPKSGRPRAYFTKGDVEVFVTEDRALVGGVERWKWRPFEEALHGLGGRVHGFPDHLREWTDFDCAAYALAEALGLVEAWDRASPIPRKGVFWSANPVGDGLTRILRQLVEMGVLETNEEAQYRVRAGFEFEGEGT